MKIAMVESCGMAEQGARCWAAQLGSCVAKCGVTMPVRGDLFFDVESVISTARERWLSRIGHMSSILEGVDRGPSQVRARSDDDRKGFKALVYFRWFAAEDGDLRSTFWYNLNRPEQISTVACFRMGCHWLDVENGRISRPRVPRSQRTCKCCGLGAREDEIHVLHCPLYVGLRWKHGMFLKFEGVEVIGEDKMMREDMNITSSPSDARVFVKVWLVF